MFFNELDIDLQGQYQQAVLERQFSSFLRIANLHDCKTKITLQGPWQLVSACSSNHPLPQVADYNTSSRKQAQHSHSHIRFLLLGYFSDIVVYRYWNAVHHSFLQSFCSVLPWCTFNLYCPFCLLPRCYHSSEIRGGREGLLRSAPSSVLTSECLYRPA